MLSFLGKCLLTQGRIDGSDEPNREPFFQGKVYWGGHESRNCVCMTLLFVMRLVMAQGRNQAWGWRKIVKLRAETKPSNKHMVGKEDSIFQ